jgi:phage repressor protein C with HTH and peptisase S24 domain
MPETPIGQRLKVPIDSLKLNVRTFSQRIDVVETTARNYLNRGTKPGTEYLEEVYNAFNEANMHWLFTGNGEPLLSSVNANNQTTANAEKKFAVPL